MKIDSKRAVSFLAVLDLIFALGLFLSGAISGVLSSVVYIIAFIVPLMLGFKSSREKNKDGDFLDFKGFFGVLPFMAPTLLLIMGVSYVMALLITFATGKTNDIDLGTSVGLAILSHALLPAVFEEALFRYLPLRVMRGESIGKTVLWSAIFFALIHHSFFSIPYAFLAGVMFMMLDIYLGSIWPSVILHFVNNTLSVLLYFYGSSQVFVWVLYSVLGVLAIVSLAYVILKKDKYKAFITELVLEKPNFENTPEVWIFISSMLIVAVMELFL